MEFRKRLGTFIKELFFFKHLFCPLVFQTPMDKTSVCFFLAVRSLFFLFLLSYLSFFFLSVASLSLDFREPDVIVVVEMQSVRIVFSLSKDIGV